MNVPDCQICVEVLLARQNFISAARFGYFLQRSLQRWGAKGWTMEYMFLHDRFGASRC